MRPACLGEQVGHQGALKLYKCLENPAGLFIEVPGNTIGLIAVQAAVGGQQAKGHPALEQIRCCKLLEASYIVTPIAEPTHGERKTATDALGHRLIGCRTVATPVYGKFLTSNSCRTCKNQCLMLAAFFLEQGEHSLIVQIGVVVVHQHRIGVIKILNLGGNPLTKIRLEGIDTHIQQESQLTLIPSHRFRIGEVDQSHAGLPAVPLPDAPVGILDQIAFLHAFIEQVRFLGHIGIDPDADLESTFMQPFQHRLGIGELSLVP